MRKLIAWVLDNPMIVLLAVLALAGGCDLLIIPSTPDRLSLDALVDTVAVLQSLGEICIFRHGEGDRGKA